MQKTFGLTRVSIHTSWCTPIFLPKWIIALLRLLQWHSNVLWYSSGIPCLHAEVLPIPFVNVFVFKLPVIDCTGYLTVEGGSVDAGFWTWGLRFKIFWMLDAFPCRTTDVHAAFAKKRSFQIDVLDWASTKHTEKHLVWCLHDYVGAGFGNKINGICVVFAQKTPVHWGRMSFMLSISTTRQFFTCLWCKVFFVVETRIVTLSRHIKRVKRQRCRRWTFPSGRWNTMNVQKCYSK